MMNIETRIPDFFIVGAAKSGTTSLWYYLGQHPQIFMTKDIGEKELGFFCDHYGLSNIDQYLNFFKGAKKDQLIGEACHAYLSSPESPELIYNANPNAKIIVILRNPVDRAYSLYSWMVNHGYEHASTFEKALKLEKKRKVKFELESKKSAPIYFRNYYYFESGLFEDQIKRYLKIFPRKSIQILTFDEFVENPSGILNRIQKFLGVEKNNKFDLEPQNETFNIKSSLLQYFLRCIFPIYATRFRVPNRIYNKLSNVLNQYNLSHKKRGKMLSATRERLAIAYLRDIEKLELMLSKDLSKWKQS